MVEVVKDRVKETTSSTGSPFTLAGAVTTDGGFVRFSSVMAIGDICDVGIKDPVANVWQTFKATYNALNTLTLTTFYASSSGSPLVLVGNATTEIFLTLTANKIVAMRIATIGALTPIGLTQTGSAPIVNDTTILTTCTSTNNSVLLVAAFPSSEIRNRGVSSAQMWPPVGEQIEYTAGINLPANIPPGNNAQFLRDVSTTPATWRM